ncbi:MAG: hypothetical protein GTO55_07770 [Armatimonadetes bacterium]|nr:hypothetical protein [Armatimonadota bacterium]NIM24161.1 hypothetical protein [Armatimonadota bacterium]NIM68020.1 hypothetical protein [Armatimonadota bacterium]NIM76515.1 hypothetical protein [Armatimonadota bacterium]NIN06254.1 hypothetical protein [Armatimonadota bacterium]
MRIRVLALSIIALYAVLAWHGDTAHAAAQTSPIISPTEILTPDKIKTGMTGYGLTVFKGNKIERFGVSVMGILRGWEFDADMILIRITSGPVVTRGWGVIDGMSGSPIYINGKLVGALAFGWLFSKEPIAGVTPIHQMVEDFSPAAGISPLAAGTALATVSQAKAQEGATLLPNDGPIRIGDRLIERARIQYGGIVSAEPSDSHTMMLRPLSTPIMVSGLGPSAMSALGKILEPHGLIAVPGGGKAPMRLSHTPRPGDAIGIQLVGGDIDLTAIGTVTHVNNGRVLAMGHPFMGTGPVDLPMVNAHIHGVMSSQYSSFKIGSSGQEMVGRWTQDRAWSVGGVLGEKAQTFPATFDMWDRDSGLHKSYSAVFGRHRTLTPRLASLSVNSAIESIAPSDEGTLRTELEVAAKGLPTLKRRNVYSRPARTMGGFLSMLLGAWGAASPSDELALLLNTLEDNPFGSVPPERISLRAEWVKERLAANIEQVRARTKRVRPGDKVEVEILIKPWGKPQERRVVEVEVPRNAPPGRLRVGIGGGLDARMLKSRLQIADPYADNLAQQWEILAREEKNDDLVVEVALRTSGVELKGKQLHSLPRVVSEVIGSANLSGVRRIRDHRGKRMDMPYVLSGGEVLTFTVETDEKEKAGRGPAVGPPSAEGPPEGVLRGLLGAEAEMAHIIRGEMLEDEDEMDADESDMAAPEMPSWEEIEELEDEDADMISLEEPEKEPKTKGILRGPRVWKQTTQKDFAEGKTFGTAINSSGEIDLAPTAQVLHSTEDGLLWAQAVDGEGNTYVGSWIDGTVKKVSEDGTVSMVFESPDIAILSIAVDGSGNIYAGSAPSGIIHKITPEGKTSELCRLPAPYIWALLVNEEEGIFAATGPDGKLFRVSPEGNAELILQAPDRHVIALGATADKTLYAATYPKGKVYRVKGDEIEPFYETVGGVTALSLAVDAAGNLFVGTSPSGRIIRVDPQGKPRLFYKSKDRHVFALYPAEDGSVYAATGPKARIYRVFPDVSAATVWDAKMGNVVALSGSGGSLSASVAEAGQVINLDLKGAAEGKFVSAVLDATGPANWGQIRWQAHLPEEASLMLETRSGGTAFPDSTWSDWSAVYTNPRGENITSPPARYLQYRATLKSTGAARPALRETDIFYLTMNRSPELKLLAPTQAPVWSGKKSIKWSATDPDKDSLTYEVFYSADSGKTWVEIKEPVKKAADKEDKEVAPSEDAKENAKEPSELDEEIAAAIDEKGHVSKEEMEQLSSASSKPESKKKPAPPTKATSMSWDTTKVSDDIYIIKVVASDRQSSPRDALSDERISEPFRVDNTPPLIVLDKRETDAPPPSEVTVADGGTYVASAQYRVDEEEWKGAYCKDGIYDSQKEIVLIDVADLPEGKHTLEVLARDGIGNEATNQVKYKKS